eukprot:1158667-Pelagomonas_calceolata.AAC.3
MKAPAQSFRGSKETVRIHSVAELVFQCNACVQQPVPSTNAIRIDIKTDRQCNAKIVMVKHA